MGSFQRWCSSGVVTDFLNRETVDISGFSGIFRYTAVANKVTLTENRSGQMIVYGGRVYYINQDDGNRLYCIDPSVQGERKVTDSPVLSFIVCEDAIFFLDTGNDLQRLSKGSTAPQRVVQNVERFFVNGNIVAQSGNRVFQFSPSGDASELIMESRSARFHLVSCSASAIYYQDAGKLHRLEDGVDTVLAEGDYAYYASLLESTDGNIYVIAYSDPAGGRAYGTLLTLRAGFRGAQ